MATLYEFLKVNRYALNIVLKNKICIADVERIELYEEWCRLKEEGHKILYIEYYLSEHYGLSTGTIRRVVTSMGNEINI